ncbi:hypothetical protein TWF506_006291 [Arthrobotrys conoides]|uniref:Peptidase metallopeptidase domain-containing protein n=1 Tax=Arthrobotrys conoides TaxID=74498 RepID=A0AAN8P1J1_9PEZI
MVNPSQICTLLPLEKDVNTQADYNSNRVIADPSKCGHTGLRLAVSDRELDNIPSENLTQTGRGDNLWEIGQTIVMRLNGGSPSLRRKVIYYARIWEKYANIHFRFLRRDSEVKDDVRILHVSFEQDKGNYSYIGTNALTVPRDKAIMNLALNAYSSTREVRRKVLHEFGHLLGCIHEHSSPASSIPWNAAAVYEYYKAREGWGRQKIYHNVLRKFDKYNISQFSDFDPKSIMIYPISESVLLPGNSEFVVPWNTRLSATDKEFIGKLYPFPEEPETPLAGMPVFQTTKD